MWNNFPYTDFHEMNLDWIIKRMKELLSEFSSISEAWEQLKSEFDDKLADNVRIELNKMYEDGRIKALLLDCLDWVTPQMYGAKADGVTDDSSAIQEALDTRKPVRFPNGTYLVDSTIVVYMDCGNVTLTDNAIIKLGNTNKAVTFGAYRNIWNPNYMHWSGGVIDCANKDDVIGMEVLRHALGSTIENLFVRNFQERSYGIAIEKDDTSPSSIQLNLNDIRIVGGDSGVSNTGIYCNAYDLYSSNLYIYEVCEGINFRKSEWHIDFLHYWYHRPNSAVCNVNKYIATYAVKAVGNMEFGNLYIDMPYKGVICGGGLVTAGKTHFITPPDNQIDTPVDFTIFDVSLYSHIDYGELTIDTSRSTDNKVHVTKTVGTGALDRGAVLGKCFRQGRPNIYQYDLAFNITGRTQTYELLCNASTITAGNYLIGYIGCNVGECTVYVCDNTGRTRYTLFITAGNTNCAIRTVEKAGTADTCQFCVDTAHGITYSDIRYVPLIMKVTSAGTGSGLAYKIKAIGNLIVCPVIGSALTSAEGTYTFKEDIKNNAPLIKGEVLTWTGNLVAGVNTLDIGVASVDYYVPTPYTTIYINGTTLDKWESAPYNPTTGKIEIRCSEAVSNATVTLNVLCIARNHFSID